MMDELDFAVRSVLIGIGGTLAMDLWAALLRKFGIPSLDYGKVGRWVGHFPRGRFVHDNIAMALPIRGERILGWSVHYGTGILFAALLLAVWGLDWARHPTVVPALMLGLATLAAPFLIMQPGIGAGIAASRTPNPMAARLRSFATHTVFGLGLYASAWLTASLLEP